MTLVGFKARNHPQQRVKDEVDDRRTPDSLWIPLDKEFRFTLDVAASPENAKCFRYFTIEDDGLAQSWSGESVWCNPPYSNCRAWVHKAWDQVWAKSIVMLLPANRTEQKWWQEMVEPFRDGRIVYGRALETRFLPGRLRFDVPEGTYSDPRGNRPPFGCVLLIWSLV